MKKFDGYLLVSDFDGTLIGKDSQIPQENIEAINYFVRQGGRFAGATGRTESNVRPYISGLPLSVPWILYNGAAIYDLQQGLFRYRVLLDHDLARGFILRIMRLLPKINVQIYPGGAFCQVNPNAAPDKVAVREKQAFKELSINEMPDGWFKVIFCSDDPEEISVVEKHFDTSQLDEKIHKTRSSPRYFELTAQGANKGSALLCLKKMIEPMPRCVVAIGDYRNDIEMLVAADISAAPDSALPEVQAHAKIITRCHTQSAIADLIQKLEKAELT